MKLVSAIAAFSALVVGASIIAAPADAATKRRVRHVAVVVSPPPVVVYREPSYLLARVDVPAGRYGGVLLPCVPQYQWVNRPGYGPYNGLFTSVCSP